MSNFKMVRKSKPYFIKLCCKFEVDSKLNSNLAFNKILFVRSTKIFYPLDARKTGAHSGWICDLQ